MLNSKCIIIILSFLTKNKHMIAFLTWVKLCFPSFQSTQRRWPHKLLVYITQDCQYFIREHMHEYQMCRNWKHVSTLLSDRYKWIWYIYNLVNINMTAALCLRAWAKPMGHQSTYFNIKKLQKLIPRWEIYDDIIFYIHIMVVIYGKWD